MSLSVSRVALIFFIVGKALAPYPKLDYKAENGGTINNERATPIKGLPPMLFELKIKRRRRDSNPR
jgi:hypothetical protein